MDQSIGQAFSGFSIVLFAALCAVIVGGFFVLVTKGALLGAFWLNGLMAKHIPLPGKLMAGTITREKKAKPGLVMNLKKANGAKS